MQLQTARLVAKGVNMRAAVFHHEQGARCSAAGSVEVWLVGVTMPAMQGIEVARPVGRMDRHAGKTGLFEIVDAGCLQLLGQVARHRRSHSQGEEPFWMKPLYVPAGLEVSALPTRQMKETR